LRHDYDQISVNNYLQNGYTSLPGDVVTKIEFLDQPPGGAALTAYDQTHLKLYVRLLDADAQGADWREVAKVLFDLDAAHDEARARQVYSAHLDRAKWMTRSGFCELLQGRLH